MKRRIARLISQVRMASRGWRPGQLWKGKAGPRCKAQTRKDFALHPRRVREWPVRAARRRAGAGQAAEPRWLM